MRTVKAALCALAMIALPQVAAAATQVAITFDDLPAHSALPANTTRVRIAQDILAALKAADAPPTYGFVNGVQVEREPASEPVLALWRKAGHPLGNHTWSHMGLSGASLADWQAEVLRNEPVLQAHMAGADYKWLRFPFLDEGDTPEKRAGARAFLGQHGYRIASVTMSFDDWAFNEPYARCVAKGDEAAIADLERRYMDAAAASLAYSRSLSRALGRDIPLVLLMHEGALDARMLPQLLAFYRREGVKLVTLQQAEADPFYAADVKPGVGPGPVTLEAAAAARGLPIPQKGWDPAALTGVCR
jgi:peptidoglycan/xylan/chitin deacetylase (PgdA/CDA1 family)